MNTIFLPGVVTKRRRVSRLRGACTAGHRELVKEGADLACLRAQDLVQGSYTTLDNNQGKCDK